MAQKKNSQKNIKVGSTAKRSLRLTRKRVYIGALAVLFLFTLAGVVHKTFSDRRFNAKASGYTVMASTGDAIVRACKNTIKTGGYGDFWQVRLYANFYNGVAAKSVSASITHNGSGIGSLSMKSDGKSGGSQRSGVLYAFANSSDQLSVTINGLNSRSGFAAVANLPSCY